MQTHTHRIQTTLFQLWIQTEVSFASVCVSRTKLSVCFVFFGFAWSELVLVSPRNHSFIFLLIRLTFSFVSLDPAATLRLP